MHIVIAGGSGFVGSALQVTLLSRGHTLSILTRSIQKVGETDKVRAVQWLGPEDRPEEELKKVDAVINLAGESINGRWTKAKKQRIIQSRLQAVEELLALIRKLDEQPKVWINASAVGYYGMSDTETFTEQDTEPAEDFLARVAVSWESAALKAEKLGLRVVLARLGVVLGQEGALPLMTLPYKLGVGGTIGAGRQWVSWVHAQDAAGLMEYCLREEEIRGAVNVTAPEPATMEEFGKTIGLVLHRPHWLPVPRLAMKLFLGEMSQMLLSGQRVLPEKALAAGYEFQYPDLRQALADLLK